MKIAALLCAALFLASHGGALHPALDSLAVLRVPLGVGVLGLCLWPSLRRARWAWAAAALTLASLALNQLLWDRSPDHPGEIVLYQKNLGYWNRAVEDLAADIRAAGADIVTLQELSPQNARLLDLLAEDFPVRQRCDFGALYSMAVLSRLPAGPEGGRCSRARGLAALQVVGESGPGWVVSVHLHWPWPFAQPGQLPEVHTVLENLEGPMIIGGDFNQMPWSHAVRSTARVAGVSYRGPSAVTFAHRGLRLPIDHVLAPSGTVERLGFLGSDHRGLRARVSFK
ncbi:MAG: endonuclease/exonuclease/phosphatase family protein [Pseudomonadota bacterium]